MNGLRAVGDCETAMAEAKKGALRVRHRPLHSTTTHPNSPLTSIASSTIIGRAL